MKAKRIAEIAHEMVQLRAEMDALSAELKDEYGKCAAHLIAKAIIENTLKATPFATAAAANSDQLRAELTANNIEMNRLTERNEVILADLRNNGLAPVALVDAGLEVCLFHEWGRSNESCAGCVLNLEGRKVDRVYTIEDSYFEIVRFGNRFCRV